MIKIFDSSAALAKAVSSEMLTRLHDEVAPTFCLAAGGTGRESFHLFAETARHLSDLKKLRIVGLDEWVGVGHETVGACYQMLDVDLFSRLPLALGQIKFFDARASDLAAECAAEDAFIEAHPITFSLMGVGMNGHIGLNEPGMPVLDHASVVELSETTRQVMQKYFDREVALTQGLSLGLDQLAASQHLIVAMVGADKADIAKQVLEEPDLSLPAQYFLNRENVDFYLDDAAASKLSH